MVAPEKKWSLVSEGAVVIILKVKYLIVVCQGSGDSMSPGARVGTAECTFLGTLNVS